MGSLSGAVPESLQFFALVAITGNQLASIQHCIQHQALSRAHLQYMPNYAASTLSSIGCVCIEESQADSASPIKAGAESLTTALKATSCCLGVPLPQLLSQERLGSTDFMNARRLLAEHLHSSPEVWNIIRQCPIFEDITGQMVILQAANSYALLPGASWEEHIVELDQLLPWSPIPYHTASAIQRKLVRHSSMRVPTLSTFLQTELLPAITRNSNEGLLLQALDELADNSNSSTPVSLTCIFIDGYLHPISKTVDRSSLLLQTLFSQPSANDDYKLLPELYATPGRLTVLKHHGLAHLSIPDPDFFIRCSKRFSGMSSSLTKDNRKCLSRGLVDMLHGNVDAYQCANHNSAQIASCSVFKSAELQFPYKRMQPEFVALASSADHDHYQLVSLALPVIDNSHGDTKALRRKLGLAAQPKLQHVVDHLLRIAMAASSDLKTALKQGAPCVSLCWQGSSRHISSSSAVPTRSKLKLAPGTQERWDLPATGWRREPGCLCRTASLCAPVSCALTWKKIPLKVGSATCDTNCSIA